MATMKRLKDRMKEQLSSLNSDAGLGETGKFPTGVKKEIWDQFSFASKDSTLKEHHFGHLTHDSLFYSADNSNQGLKPHIESSKEKERSLKRTRSGEGSPNKLEGWERLDQDTNQKLKSSSKKYVIETSSNEKERIIEPVLSNRKKLNRNRDNQNSSEKDSDAIVVKLYEPIANKSPARLGISTSSRKESSSGKKRLEKSKEKVEKENIRTVLFANNSTAISRHGMSSLGQLVDGSISLKKASAIYKELGKLHKSSTESFKKLSEKYELLLKEYNKKETLGSDRNYEQEALDEMKEIAQKVVSKKESKPSEKPYNRTAKLDDTVHDEDERNRAGNWQETKRSHE